MKTKVLGIIPARYGSTRFPGKPLAPILGKSLIQRTYENAKQCSSLDKIVVATDDKRIYDHVRDFGGSATLTKINCQTGSDRIAVAIQKDPHLQAFPIVLNIQGDWPCLDPIIIEKVATLLIQDTKANVSTAIVPLNSEKDLKNPSIVKCVVDRQGYALYFSRFLSPQGKSLPLPYYKHLGIYGFRNTFLPLYLSLTPTPLQLTEDLEQLKILEHGYKIKTTVVTGDTLSVDTPGDIKKAEDFLCKNISLSQEACAPL